MYDFIMENITKKMLCQMFVIGLDGDELNENKNLVTALSQGLGGVIFFTQNIKSAKRFKKLIAEIKANAFIPPFLAIDQEGGRVERTENIHNGKKYLSAKFAYQKGLEFLKSQTEDIAHELKNYGLNLNFAPCIDVNTNPNNPIIGERAFSSNPNDVIKGGKLVASVYRDNGILPCIKHFPGHGDADSDSHKTLPEIKIPFEELEKFHIKPFKSLIEDGIEMVMVAHLYIPHFEKDVIPTSLSKNAIDYLRKALNFEGVAVSDDMIMKGVSKFGSVKACEMGIRAGLNMLIYRNSNPETISIIEEIYKMALDDVELSQNIEKSFEKISKLKEKIK